MSEQQNSSATPVTAAVLVIGDEILSGRTKDRNIGFIAEYLTNIGVDLKEVRVVPDEHQEIVDAVNALRRRYHYVFTTGGIGPTHDDITADAIAAAFGVSIDVDERAVQELLKRLRREDLTPARLRMARIPAGAELVLNEVSSAPGFWIGNVITMAGVPAIMQSMMDWVGPRLRTGQRMLSTSIRADAREGDVAAPFGEVARVFPDVIMGSYPFNDEKGFNTNLVLRSRDAARLEQARQAVEAMLAALPSRDATGVARP
ncbi:competence/damage-inducible protein A [Camelimonas lactis]|uniref:Molybdenum cofactor synthesis domain-containing protein n=1 Tax=Camelimonas lactis TaxID=659006 RepID=A0A4R2GR97_9HYPH|nr:molybdopterin-binding protein [Camelimonas lactis]TCO11523.1 molybdenum cofactor synthesis domain-containing protein [Camelimonas lactis]